MKAKEDYPSEDLHGRQASVVERKQTTGTSRDSEKDKRGESVSDKGADFVRDVDWEVSGDSEDLGDKEDNGRGLSALGVTVSCTSGFPDSQIFAQAAWHASLEHELDVVRMQGRENGQSKAMIEDSEAQVLESFQMGRVLWIKRNLKAHGVLSSLWVGWVPSLVRMGWFQLIFRMGSHTKAIGN